MKKKIFILLAIVAALTLVLVACQDPKPEETTPVVTDAPTDPATPTEEPTAAPTDPVDTPTDADTPTTEEVTTEEPTEAPTLPYKDPSEFGMIGKAVDAFGVNNTATVLDETRTVSIKTGDKFQDIRLMGWVGFGQAIESYGYFMNDAEYITDPSFLVEVPAEDPVKGAGGEFAQRFVIVIPASAFAVGETKVVFAVKLADGSIAKLDEAVTVNVEKTLWEGSGVVVHQSFDALIGGADRNAFFAEGSSNTWDLIATVTDNTVETLGYWGWVGFKGEFGQFGYQIDGGEAIYDDTWAFETGADVIGAAQNGGADSGQRMLININIKGLTEGAHTITVLYKAADTTEGEGEEAVTVPGAVVILNEFTLNAPAPAKIEPALTIKVADLAPEAITGHRPGVTSGSAEMNAAGLAAGAQLHCGSVALGSINLGQYSKAVIYFATDWSEGTQTALAEAQANGQGRIGLSTTAQTGTVVNDPVGFISAQYTPAGGWTLTPVEIGLLPYEGEVFISADFLAGQFIIIDRIEFYA